MLAAVGLLRQAPVEFESSADVPLGGVLWALPALLAEGLLRHSRKLFALPEGFYPLETIFLVLAFMALVRVRSLEALRYEPPGEWGELVGLDRIPEVRTLRQKLGQLCQPPGVATRWSSQLAREWMVAQPDHDGVYYADGHVRVYHGKLAALPRRYVARQKLCLRGTTDYWINALDGRPFFLVSRPVDPGLIEVLRTEIVPRLLEDAPGQPTAAALAEDPLLHRFTLVFDRAGYSPEFFSRAESAARGRDHLSQVPGPGLAGSGVHLPAPGPGQRRVRHPLSGRARHLSEQRPVGPGNPGAGNQRPSGERVGDRLPLRTAAHCGADVRAVDAGKLPQIHAGTLRH